MDNIRYGKLDATDEEVMEAARVVYAHELIKGYGGRVLYRSTGTWIHVPGAEAAHFWFVLFWSILKFSYLMKLTSSIDTRTEILIQSEPRELLKGRTSFVIAHRLLPLQEC